ncbi:zinc finger protein 236 [Drosophila ficusphila]|uniref:zinc finger protein 236 n=1 Tax=Drosophila ficusphila TaxID=30025 RepID=UPI0007E5E200|nr:zinc finger protein 236 [Drosophila ficusphila]
MELCADLNGFDEDSIEPCRTCGIYFTMGMELDQAIVKPIFGLHDAAVGNMEDILEQLSAWNVKIAREDGRPQYMCIACIAEFNRLLKFKRSCLETQEQFGELEYQREHNGIIIKREIEPEEEKFCGFIYLDTDEEEISDEDGSRRVCAAFDIPHVPIKEEHMARVPEQSSALFQPPRPKELDMPPVESGFNMIDNDMSTVSFFTPSSEDASGTADDGDQEEEDEIIRFTYDDDGDSVAQPPAPAFSPVVSCKLCLYDSPNQEAHLDHMRRTHLLKDWECHICAKKFTNAPESRIKFHMKYHKLQRHIKCPVCGFICNSKETLKEHKQAMHTRTKCTYCGKTMKSTVLHAHLKKHLQEGEAELALKLKLQNDFPSSMASPSLFIGAEATAPLETPSTSGTSGPMDSTLPQNSTLSEDCNVSENTTAPKDTIVPDVSTASEDTIISEAFSKDILYPMDPPARVNFPISASSSPSVSTVIQCAYCSDTFEEVQQLQAHVLATHRSARKRPRSPENTSPIPMESAGNEESQPQEESFAKKNCTAQQESRTEESLNGSSSAEQVPEKSYYSCQICGKLFDLKIKLNRHLKQHKKLPMGDI